MRLFIALPLSVEVEQSLGNIIKDLTSYGGKIKWVEPRNIHLTVKFLGETKESQIEPIKNEIKSIGAKYQAMSSDIINIGAFPNLQKPQVIWVGMREVPRELMPLVADVENATHRLGWEKERRPFKPHFTLGRVKDDRDLQKLTDALPRYFFPAIPFSMQRLTLFQSILTPQGPRYTSLLDIPLTERFSG